MSVPGCRAMTKMGLRDNMYDLDSCQSLYYWAHAQPWKCGFEHLTLSKADEAGWWFFLSRSSALSVMKPQCCYLILWLSPPFNESRRFIASTHVKMSAINLRNPLALLQRPKPVWENPELSIGPFRGVAKGGMKYWDAQGPAQEAYDQFSTDIQQILNSSCGPVRCSSAVVYDIYMVGRESSTAIPHVMFSCKQPKSRKQAVAAVRKSGIMQRWPGIDLGHWEYPPHILNLRLLASSGITDDLDDDLTSYYCLRRIIDPETPTETLAIQFILSGPTDHRVATIGSVTEHNGKLFYVLPHHIFSAPYATDMDSELEDSSDCEFGAFASDDLISDEEAEFTSQYSISPPLSDTGSDSESDAEDVFSDGELDDWSLPRPEEIETGTTDDDEYSERLFLRPHLPKGDSVKRLARDPDVSSPDLDYALLEADPDDDLLAGLPVLSKENVSKVSPGGAAVTTVTGAGHVLHGRLSGRVSYVRAPNAATFQEALVVNLNGPLHPGDCGSIVRDNTTGKIYGHIFLGSVESGVAYIMPAGNVLRHVRTTLERLDEGIISGITDSNDSCMRLSTTSITRTAMDSHHQLMVRRPTTYSEYKDPWICAVHPTDLAGTAMLDDANDKFTSQVDNARMTPSDCQESFALLQAQKSWLQRTGTDQNMERFLYRDRASGELRTLCYEMEGVDRINEIALVLTRYLSDNTDSDSHGSDHQYAERVIARITEILSDIRKTVPVTGDKREDDTALTRVGVNDISGATRTVYMLGMHFNTGNAKERFVRSILGRELDGQQEIPMVGGCSHDWGDTYEYLFGSQIFVIVCENARTFR